MTHHVIEGPDDAPVVALSGSLGSTHAMWDEQAAALAGEFRVLRIDHRGHGGSPSPPGPYTVDDLAGDVLALLDDLGIDRVAFVGLSLGGAVGQMLALRAPERIERLALCCTSSHFGPPEGWHERAATVRDGGIEAVAPAVLERWLSPAAPPALRERLQAMLLSIDPEGYAACCEAIAAHDVRGRLAALRMPVLAIAGSDDPATPPEWLEEIAGEVPGARLHVIDGARHIANVEYPQAFNRVLAPFLRASAGMRVRREVLGDAHVDAAIERTTGFTAGFQDLITRYAWGEIWTRPGLDRRMRSAITLTALVAGGHENELAMHTRAALRNGLTPEEIEEILLQTAIYCGVPAANAAFAIAQRVIGEEAK
jgi:3-oxoadipate enol-lactonase / 4-carboxymuconolactone decarboxylase